MFIQGVSEDGRVLMKTPALEVEESLKILKPLLNRCTSSLTVRNDLQDMGVYFMSRWVLTFLMVSTNVCRCTYYFFRRRNPQSADLILEYDCSYPVCMKAIQCSSPQHFTAPHDHTYHVVKVPFSSTLHCALRPAPCLTLLYSTLL